MKTNCSLVEFYSLYSNLPSQVSSTKVELSFDIEWNSETYLFTISSKKQLSFHKNSGGILLYLGNLYFLTEIFCFVGVNYHLVWVIFILFIPI